MTHLFDAIRRGLQNLSAQVARREWIVWLLLVASVAAPRLWLHALCPVYIWSGDSAGYLYPALRWLEEGVWVSDPRRGPIYSGFIAGLLKTTGNLYSVVIVQHILCGLSILAGCALLRFRFGNRALIPILLCGLSAAIYGLPLYLAHLIRNEALLMVGATMGLAGLYVGLGSGGRKRLWFLALAGLGGALVNLTKNVFLPWPILGLAAILWPGRGGSNRWVLSAAAFVLGYGVPMIGAKLAESAWPGSIGGVSYAGVQLYGRVAQWTVVDSGIHPEIKEAIRPLVIEYRQREKLDNNWVIKRGIIPVIGRTLGSTEDRQVDKICRELALEAIRAHPREYLAQAGSDLGSFLFEMGRGEEVPKSKDLKKLADNLERMPEAHPSLNRSETVAVYLEPDRDRFRNYHRLIGGSWVFETFPPVLLTSLLMILFIFIDKRDRPFWVVATGIWCFNLILLSTVGKPMHRYLMPLVPVMILAAGTGLCKLWALMSKPGGDREPAAAGGD